MLYRKIVRVEVLITILLLFFGFYLHVFLPLGYSLEYIYGDLGDARFNNYLLEHNYLFIIGKVDSYWSTGFMYPNKDMLAVSDNLMGSSPFYIIFRIFNFSVETSYQLWFIVVSSLNFFCSFFVFKRLSNNVAIAAIGAFIFAFNISLFGQYNHLQVLPRFITPIAIYYLVEFIQSKKVMHYAIFVFATIYQFYCGIYLGFILLLPVLFILLYSLFVDYKSYIQLIFSKVKMLKIIVITLIAIILLMLLMYPYYIWSKQLGDRSFNEVENTLPTIFSYLSSVNGTLLWKPLENLFILPIKWDHLLFPGIISLVSVFVFIGILFKLKSKEYGYYFIGFLLFFIFTIRVFDFTMYRYVFYIPGFNSMRSLGRVINIELFFFSLFTVLSLKYIVERTKYKHFTLVIGLIFVVLDQTIVSKPSAVYSKLEAQDRISDLRKKVRFLDSIQTFAYCPEKIELPLSYYNIDAMLLSQEINIPTINGYSATCPNSICNFITTLETNNLFQWVELNKLDENKLLVISDQKSEIASITYKDQKSDILSLREVRSLGSFISQIKADSSWLNLIKDKANKKGVDVEKVIAEDSKYMHNMEIEIVRIENSIIQDTEWLKLIKEKALKKGVSIEKVLREDAVYMYNKNLKK